MIDKRETLEVCRMFANWNLGFCHTAHVRSNDFVNGFASFARAVNLLWKFRYDEN